MRGKSSKTVYVLGAGFSYGAGFPLQEQILDSIKNFKITGLLDVPSAAIDSFEPSQKRLCEFLDRVFSQDVTPSLEDVFTLLDQTIERRGSCAGFAWTELEQCQSDLKQAILFILHAIGAKIKGDLREFYRSVAAYLVKWRIDAGQESDPFSIVSLNWDSLLEDSIYWCIGEISARRRVDIDYCCYTTPLETSIPHTPSIRQKALGIYNVKMMKLHGSANWLFCPNCNRLFTGIGGESTVWELYVHARACPVCTQQCPELVGERLVSPPTLVPFFISPTYVKKFDNPHIQMTWHNAFLELSEATEVIFIGYSLPEADYHVRTLLRRSVRKNANITVVLTERDAQKRNTPKKLARYLPANRYFDFFGKRRVNFDSSRVQGYFCGFLGEQKLSRRIGYLKRLLNKVPATSHLSSTEMEGL